MVFICGTARGGTTLLARLLDGHPALAVLPWDTQVGPILMDRPISRAVLRAAPMLDWYGLPAILGGRLLRRAAFHDRWALAARLARWLQDFPAPPPNVDAIAAAAAARATTPDTYWTAFFEVLADVAGADLLERPIRVEKTPLNELLAALLDRLFGPETRYVHVVRDPRAVVASWLANRPLGGAARERAMLARCVDWSRSVDCGRHGLSVRPGRVHVLRYEDLVDRTAGVMEGVRAFLGIQAYEHLTVPTHLGVPASANSSFGGPAPPGVVLRKPAERYREVLTGRELGLVEGWLGAQMTACGYPVDDRPPGGAGESAPTFAPRMGPRSISKRFELARRRRRFRAGPMPWVLRTSEQASERTS